MLRPLQHPQTISAVKAEPDPWPRAFACIALKSRCCYCSAWCRWGASLLPNHSQKLVIVKQWLELAVACPVSQFHWQWQQWVIDYKLVLVLSLDQLPIQPWVFSHTPSKHSVVARITWKFVFHFSVLQLWYLLSSSKLTLLVCSSTDQELPNIHPWLSIILKQQRYIAESEMCMPHMTHAPPLIRPHTIECV